MHVHHDALLSQSATRIQKRAGFVAVTNNRQKCVTRTVVVQWFVRPQGIADGVRVGFTATKRLGNAVMRNRCKRRMREVWRLHAAAHSLNGVDYVLVAREALHDADFSMIIQDVVYAMKRIRKNIQQSAPPSEVAI